MPCPQLRLSLQIESGRILKWQKVTKLNPAESGSSMNNVDLKSMQEVDQRVKCRARSCDWACGYLLLHHGLVISSINHLKVESSKTSNCKYLQIVCNCKRHVCHTWLLTSMRIFRGTVLCTAGSMASSKVKIYASELSLPAPPSWATVSTFTAESMRLVHAGTYKHEGKNRLDF